MYGAAFLDNYGVNCYGYNYKNTLILLGQKQDTLYFTINNDFKPQANSAASTAWAKDVKGSHGYIVMDVDNIMKNEYIIREFSKEFEEDDYYYENDKEDEIFNDLAYKAIDKISYIYFNITSPTSVELVVVMDDKQTNALKQYVDLVKPYMLTILASEAL
jgi:hypothetical protein